MLNIYEFNQYRDFDSFSNLELFIIAFACMCVGSFAQSVIYRSNPKILNKNKLNIFYPRSFCPNCKKQINPLYLIPLLGFLFQVGKCIKCKEKISIEYPLAEISFLLIGLLLVYLYGLNLFFYIIFLIFFLFYILFFLDLKFFYLPFGLNITLILIGLTTNGFLNMFVDSFFNLLNGNGLLFSLYGFFFGFFTLWSVNFFYRLLRKKDGIGGGDFILLGAIGSIFGPVSLIFILLVSSLIGCIFFLINKEAVDNRLPFGSFLIVGSIIYFITKILNF